MPNPDPRRLQPKIEALQLNSQGVLSLFGDDGLRLWEILKGITTPAEFRLVDHQIGMIKAQMDQVQKSVKALESAAKEIHGAG